MTYPYPADPTVITQLLVDKIEAAKATFRIPVIDVYYGDQDMFPHTPSVCVETGDKTRTLEGAPNMTLNEFEIYVLIYHNKVQDNQSTRKETDQIAYDIEQLVHQDLQLRNGGLTPNVIHGFIRSHESGYTFKKDTLYRSARLTYYGKNKTSLPTA
jgi:hypothetical protein